MAKLMKKSPSLKLLPILVLLVIIPLLSTSLRFKYLYFIVNVLIIALVAEAGLFSFTDDKKLTPGTQHEQPPPPTISQVSEEKSPESDNGIEEEEEEEDVEKSVENAENRSWNKVFVQVQVIEASATPASIFFIEGGDNDDDEEEEEDQVKEDGNEGDQDLFHKAESFIGNFYKQLKMQRELSSNRLSQKAF